MTRPHAIMIEMTINGMIVTQYINRMSDGSPSLSCGEAQRSSVHVFKFNEFEKVIGLVKMAVLDDATPEEPA